MQKTKLIFNYKDVSGMRHNNPIHRYLNELHLDTPLFIIVLSGRINLTINLLKHEAVRGDFISIMNGNVIKINELSEGFDAYFVSVSLELARDIDLIKTTMPSLINIHNSPVIPLKEEESISVVTDYCKLLNHVECTTIIFKQEVIKNMMEALYFMVLSLYRNSPIAKDNIKLSRKEDIYRKFLELVILDYRKNRTVAYYADLLSVSPKYLAVITKEMSGKDPSGIINETVVLIAKNHLKNSELSVQQIAYKLGFPNPSFFGKYFKKYIGVSPKRYRDS